MCKTIVWDWNGTLLNDVQASLDSLNAILRTHNLPRLSLADYRAQFVYPVPAFYHHLGLEPDPESWVSIAEVYHLRFCISPKLRPHLQARETLQACRARGYRLMILSALEQNLLFDQVRESDLLDLFDAVIGSDNVNGSSKQNKARSLNLPAGTLLVGDTLHDAEVAKALGWHAILVNHGHQDDARLSQACVPIIQSLPELLTYL